MRSTTCTDADARADTPASLPWDTWDRMKGAVAAAVLAALALPAAAQDPAPGCWARDYDAAHLAANPAQVVQSMRLAVPKAPRQDGVRICVTFANQGHVAGTAMAGRQIAQGMFCVTDTDLLTCGIECDGGTAEFRPRADGALDLVTNYLLLGDPSECGGIVDLAEVQGRSVTYRLYPADPALCAGL